MHLTDHLHHAVARVKRILALDEDIHQCSNNGAFVLTVATVGTIRDHDASIEFDWMK